MITDSMHNHHAMQYPVSQHSLITSSGFLAPPIFPVYSIHKERKVMKGDNRKHKIQTGTRRDKPAA